MMRERGIWAEFSFLVVRYETSKVTYRIKTQTLLELEWCVFAIDIMAPSTLEVSFKSSRLLTAHIWR